MKNKKIVLIVLPLVLAACAPGLQTSTDSTTDMGNQITEVITCPTSRSAIFNAYYKAYDGLSSEESIERSLKLGELSNPLVAANGSVVASNFKSSLQGIHDILTTGVQLAKAEQLNAVRSMSETDLEETDLGKENDPMLHLTRLELRSEISPVYAELNRKLDAALAQAEESARQANINCNEESANLDQPVEVIDEDVRGKYASYHPLYGALWTMATAYQSCNAIEIPAMDASTPSAQGVRLGAKNGDGYKREYSDKALLAKTHPYIKGQTYSGSCVDQRNKPLVYDYGGKTYVEKSDGRLNLFVNYGSGGGALGIDCSGYVSTAAAKAGNLYKVGSTNKPYYSSHGSSDFVRASGWSCYDSVSVTAKETIRPGDILAIVGHVVMIDEVRNDPFGLNLISSSSQCSSISHKNFNFAITQSSPSKGSVGINRYEAKDYFSESSRMRTAIVAYAKKACESKFDGKVKTPKTSSYNMIRHKGTTNCLAPQIKLVNEACIERCPSLRL